MHFYKGLCAFSINKRAEIFYIIENSSAKKFKHIEIFKEISKKFQKNYFGLGTKFIIKISITISL